MDGHIRILIHLVKHLQQGKIKPKDPSTHLFYSNVLSDLNFPDTGRTPGDSLNNAGMARLAQWLRENNLPAITGLIVNKGNNPERPLMPSKLFFTSHDKQDLDYEWLYTEIEKALTINWEQVLKSNGITLDDEDSLLPEELGEVVTRSLTEGAKKTITVNAYERNAQARNECLRKHGYSCAVCSFNFKEIYGDLGDGYIHVHHKTPLSEINEEYTINPEEDLVPVCPNCHAMLHRKGNRSIEELQKTMKYVKALKQKTP